MDTLLMLQRRKNIQAIVVTESIRRSLRCEEAAKSLLYAAEHLNLESHFSNFDRAAKKFEEIESDLAVKMIQTDCYALNLGNVVHRNRSLFCSSTFFRRLLLLLCLPSYISLFFFI